MTRRSGWPATGRHSERRGTKRTPEALRRKVIAKADRCYFSFPDICQWGTGPVEVHHICEAEDGGRDEETNLAAACRPCHTRWSAQQSQRRSVQKQNEWKRKPETRPSDEELARRRRVAEEQMRQHSKQNE